MGMYTANITLGWDVRDFEGDDACEIMDAASNFQDFGCLLRMGRMNEGKKGQKELDKLEAFLDKYHEGTLTIEDLKSLDVKLSIGEIVCNSVTEN